jgi:hypothetical protein
MHKNVEHFVMLMFGPEHAMTGSISKNIRFFLNKMKISKQFNELSFLTIISDISESIEMK